jgi:hypothetical protein
MVGSSVPNDVTDYADTAFKLDNDNEICSVQTPCDGDKATYVILKTSIFQIS